MKKKIFTAIFLIISILWISDGYAQQRYVRKKVKPEFFIPESAYDKPEKLPEFILPPEPQIEPVVNNNSLNRAEPLPLPEYITGSRPRETTTIQSPTPVAPVYEEPQYVEAVEPQINDDFDEEVFESAYLYFVDDIDLRELPLYKQKYDEYLDDLQAISETGEMPENSALAQDLSMMNSDLKIIVKDEFGIKYEPKTNEQTEEILILE